MYMYIYIAHTFVYGYQKRPRGSRGAKKAHVMCFLKDYRATKSVKVSGEVLLKNDRATKSV